MHAYDQPANAITRDAFILTPHDAHSHNSYRICAYSNYPVNINQDKSKS